MLFIARVDTSRFPSFWQLQTIGWGCLYLWALLGAIPDRSTWADAGRVDTAIIVLMLLGSSALRPVCRTLRRRSASWLRLELIAAAFSAALGNASALAIRLFFHVNIDWSDFVSSAMQFSLLLFTWCSLYFSIKQWQQSGQERERLLRLEAEAREARLRAETDARDARLRALRYQLNPHFLFNSLNAVSTLVLDGNAPAATRMLAQIGDLLRMSLSSEVMVEVPLSQEIAFTERYLAIEQTRLQERLQVDMAISSETLGALVPSMLLQPLVENAVRYGVAPLVEGGTIAIESAIQDSRLRIVIGNSGRPNAETHKENGNGIGLRNTAERLKTLYGSNYKFVLEWPKEGGCEVTVELPFRSAHSKEAPSCAR